MKRVSGLHVVDSGLANEEEEPLPPKNGTPGNGASRPSLDRNRLTRLLKERRYEDGRVVIRAVMGKQTLADLARNGQVDVKTVDPVGDAREA